MTHIQHTSIIFFGTSAFAVPILEALVRGEYRIAAVVTNPDEPAGRKNKRTPPPMKTAGEKFGIPVFQPEHLNFETFKLFIPPADLYIVAAYGKIIPKEILEIPKFKCLNIHPSLLPRWRGPSPIQYAILAGDKETGVTIMQVDGEMDHGSIAANVKIQISNDKIAYSELHDILSKEGAKLLLQILPRWIKGEIIPQAQDHGKATFSKMLKKEDGRIDWLRPAEEIERTVRAFNPWPSAWTAWPQNGREMRIRIDEADIAPDGPSGASPGLIWRSEAYPLAIQCGKGSLAVKKLTLESKNSTDATSFVRGNQSIIGARMA